MSDKYVLDESGEPTPCPDLMTWARWFETADRVVRQDDVGGVMVSTVFLGLDHAFGVGPPLLYETMTFGPGGADCDLVDRYSNRFDALKGHRAAVERLRRLQNAPAGL